MNMLKALPHIPNRRPRGMLLIALLVSIVLVLFVVALVGFLHSGQTSLDFREIEARAQMQADGALEEVLARLSAGEIPAERLTLPETDAVQAWAVAAKNADGTWTIAALGRTRLEEALRPQGAPPWISLRIETRVALVNPGTPGNSTARLRFELRDYRAVMVPGDLKTLELTQR